MTIEFIEDDPNQAFQAPITQHLLKVMVYRTIRKPLSAQEILEASK